MKEILIRNPYDDLLIFEGMDSAEILRAIQCLCAHEKHYEKEEHIIHVGERVNQLAVLLSGNVYVYNIHSTGERNILFELKRGDLIGGSLVFSKENVAPFGMMCVDKCCVLQIDPKEVLSNLLPVCPSKSRLMKNLLFLIAEENNLLRNKLYISSIKSLREKIYYYLYLQASIQKKNSFTIPFINRSDFADYLNVNCSALSRELGRMKEEDILDFYRNSFVLKRYP